MVASQLRSKPMFHIQSLALLLLPPCHCKGCVLLIALLLLRFADTQFSVHGMNSKTWYPNLLRSHTVHYSFQWFFLLPRKLIDDLEYHVENY